MSADLNAIDMERFVAALSQVMQPPFQIIQRVVNNHYQFAIAHSPSEVHSDDEPPFRLTAEAEVIPIDRVLGTYDPDVQQITIFRKGIDLVAEILKLRPRDVEFVVRLHEWAHALLHIGLPEAERISVTRDESLWPSCLARSNDWFKGQDPHLHEALAQLLTHHGLGWLRSQTTLPEAQATVERISHVFERLTAAAPGEYHIDQYSGSPTNRVVESIHLLKVATLIGFDAWKTVMTW